ncbi:hypothetical protein [Methylomarinum vadi]|uniref:hypothetical protein n=1 Tax=Methylomarinum vadi TaxID=438855 RepID=UPI0004DF9EBD|nr:hypothetical protein [Methylomarinum vadi]
MKTKTIFKTVLAKLTLALLLIFILLGVFGVSLTLVTTHLYRQEVMQNGPAAFVSFFDGVEPEPGNLTARPYKGGF